MPDHKVRLISGRYMVAACTCEWTGPRRRKENTAAADAAWHICQVHQLATIESPTIFDWTKVQGACSCRWKGEWHERSLGVDLAWHRARSDADEHRQSAISEAWEVADA